MAKGGYLELRRRDVEIALLGGVFRPDVQRQRPPGAGGPAMDPKDVTSFGVSVAPNLRGRFELDIDRIEFYR